MAWYRLRVDWTYSTTASATTALTAINATLTANGRTEQAVRETNRVYIIIEPLTVQGSTAITLYNALTPNWATGTRTAGKASLVMRDESSS